MYGFNLGIDLFATFVMPWVGVVVGWVLCWLWMTVRHSHRQQK